MICSVPWDYFIVTGLPRSRTGWLANLLTYGPCFCLHDALVYGDSHIAALQLKAGDENPALKHFGVSDSGYLLLPQKSWFTKAKVVLIDRPMEQALHSFMEYFWLHPYPVAGRPNEAKMRPVFERAAQRMQTVIKEAPLGRLLVVPFKDLDNAIVCARIWRFICPEVPFNLSRWSVLNHLAVNPASEKVGPKGLKFGLQGVSGFPIASPVTHGRT
jgi:hypothetical protein